MKRRKKEKKLKKEAVLGFGMAVIPIVGFLIFGFIPLVAAIIMGFMDIKGYNLDGAAWSGITNYVYVLNDGKFWLSIVNTFVGALALPLSIVLSLFISVLLNKKLKGTKFFRTVFFIPYVCSVVALTFMWRWLFEENFGILNQFLTTLGLSKIGWVSDSNYFRQSMIVMGVWNQLGFNVILLSAALTNVPRVLYEAAEIDGASKIRQFFAVTLPSISPSIFFLLVTGLIGSLQDFSRFQMMAGDSGGPGNAGLTAVFYIWQMAFRYNTTMGMGYASAASIIVAVMIGLVTLINFALSKLWVSYD